MSNSSKARTRGIPVDRSHVDQKKGHNRIHRGAPCKARSACPQGSSPQGGPQKPVRSGNRALCQESKFTLNHLEASFPAAATIISDFGSCFRAVKFLTELSRPILSCSLIIASRSASGRGGHPLYVNIDWYNTVNTLHRGIGTIHPTRACTGTHRHDPFWLSHLLVDSTHDLSHL